MVSAMAEKTKTIFEILGMEPDGFSIPIEPEKPHAGPNGKPLGEEDLKALTSAKEDVLKYRQHAVEAVSETHISPAQDVAEEIDMSQFSSPTRRFFSRNYVQYPLIFVIAVGFFYVVLNFSAIYTQIKSFLVSPASQEAVVPEVPAPQYSEWVRKYYVHLGNQNLLIPKNDADFDGLLNAEEFYLKTNPLRWDTDMDGFSDGQDVLNGYNPLYTGQLTGIQEQLVADYVDLESVRSRLALREFQQVAGEQSISVGREFTIDTSKPGQISIPAIGEQAAIIWTTDFTKMEEDLKSGAAHHPSTPFPGERGTVSIHGHSSGNIDDGNFKTVFTKLNFLEPGDEVLVTIYNSNSEGKQFRYVVRSSKVFSKTDPAQFEQKDGYFLNLSTSWPIGTALQRFVVTTELVGL